MKKIVLSTILLLGIGGSKIFAETQLWDKKLKEMKECTIPKGYDYIRAVGDSRGYAYVETKKGNEYYIFICEYGGVPYVVIKVAQEK